MSESGLDIISVSADEVRLETDSSSAAMAVLGERNEVIEVNDGFASLFGSMTSSLIHSDGVGLIDKLIYSDYSTIESFLEQRRTFEVWKTRIRAVEGSTQEASWVEIRKVHAGPHKVLNIQRILPPVSELRENPIGDHRGSNDDQQPLLLRLLELESNLKNIHERWPGIIFTQRINMTFREISPKIQMLTGFSPGELDKKPGAFWQLVHESDHEEIKKNLALVGQSPQGVNSTFRIKNRKTGKISYIMEHRIAVNRGGLLVSFHGVWIDVTRQMIAEKRLMGSAWKETLAVLTMGLAHDFRNTMAGIASLSDTLIGDFSDGDPTKEYLEDIRKNSLHANQLVQKILDLHQGKTGEAQYENLNNIASDVGDLVKKITPRRIQFNITLSTKKLPVWIDPVEFRQVVVNLALNAVDAIEKNGELIIETGVHESSEYPSHLFGVQPTTPSCYFSVMDSGSGIPEAKISKIFEPFFTSKPMNKGSGLGLYNSKLFVERHNGGISVESEVGKGTKFTLFLPLQNLESAETEESSIGNEEQITRLASDETEFISKPKPTILLAGNPGESLESASAFLRAQGFSIFEVVQKVQAMDLLEQRPADFRALLVLIEDGCDEWLSYLDELKMADEKIPIILKLQHCDQDTLRDSEIQMASWIISPETSRMEVLEKLSLYLEEKNG